MNITETAFKKAREIIEMNVSPYGLMASAEGYRQVWARDLGIAALGATLLNNDTITEAIKISLDTLKEEQSDSGAIPIYVSASKRPIVRFGVANCSGIDATMWYIITLYYLWQIGKLNDTELREYADSIQAGLQWLRCQDSNEDYLLEVPENSDWRDLWFYRHHVLYDDTLYYAVQYAAGEMAKTIGLKTTGDPIMTKDRINLFYWVSLENMERIFAMDRENAFSQSHIGELYAHITGLLESYPYYLPYVALSDFGLECDVVGNLLAIIFGVASTRQTGKILDYLDQCGAAYPYPIGVLDNPVSTTDPRWSRWFAKAHLNMPYQYHNGGIWPFVGGFYVAALVKAGRMDEAVVQLESLAEACQVGKESDWEFNEWLHKQTGKPMGSPHQLWSAAMYCYAFHAVTKGEIAIFQPWS
jgi:glycogen debranching enzyme